MLDAQTRAAVLKLHEAGHGARTIARALGISRTTVRKVVAEGQAEAVAMARASALDEHLERVRALVLTCEQNLVRVHEELAAEGIEVGYSSVTRFCQRHGLVRAHKAPSGRYETAPGKEMQHDTSPHKPHIGGHKVAVECASLVLGYSRALYFQCYRRWSRLEARSFMAQALAYFGGAASRCIVDNSSIVLARGTGPTADVAEVMRAQAERYGFVYEAHHLGDKNRSGKVERPFRFIEGNFYAGRKFEDMGDLNRQAIEWCERVNSRPKRALPMTPAELLVAERPHLRALPLHVPEVYDLHSRRVDVDGYVNLHTNRYSVMPTLVGRRLDVHETLTRVRLFDGRVLAGEHDKAPYAAKRRVLAPEHRVKRPRRKPVPPSDEERHLQTVDPALAELAKRLRRRHGGQALRAMRRLYKLYLDYPTDALVAAVTEALAYDLEALDRIESMTLERVSGTYFRLPEVEAPPPTGTDSPRSEPAQQHQQAFDFAPDTPRDSDETPDP